MTIDLNARSNFEKALADLCNRYSRENASGTPDFILGRFLIDSLKTYELAVNSADRWYGFPRPEPKVTSPRSATFYRFRKEINNSVFNDWGYISPPPPPNF